MHKCFGTGMIRLQMCSAVVRAGVHFMCSFHFEAKTEAAVGLLKPLHSHRAPTQVLSVTWLIRLSSLACVGVYRSHLIDVSLTE